MIILLALLLAAAGVLLGFNGFVVSAGAQTAEAQILGAIYLVGGVGIFGLALIAFAVRLARPVTAVEPAAVTPTAITPASSFVAAAVDPVRFVAEPVKGDAQTTTSSGAGTCVNCGRPITHRRKVCDCGKAL